LIEFILGGARSGKSQCAERRAQVSRETSGKACRYIATAQAGDAEMAARIRLHREQRRGFELTIEEPLALASVLAEHMHESRCLLVDCLTLWLTNLMLADDPATFARERAQLFEVLAQARGHIIFVSNEVGQGIVPMDALSRRFVDESGRLHQELARIADNVVFMTAGLPQLLKGSLV
jgi:adenosylcobinamide kinase/adenosylcobinamide-phosphate guanylyltransferase